MENVLVTFVGNRLFGRKVKRAQNTCNSSPYLLRPFISFRSRQWVSKAFSRLYMLNTLRTGDEDLRFYITTVQDGWRKPAFWTCACFPCTVHL